MKKISITIIVGLLVTLYTAVSAGSGTLSSDELIKKNIEAMGGKSRIESMDNLKVVFEADSPQLRGEITIWIKDGDKYRMDVNQGAEFPINSLIVTPTLGLGNNAQGGVDTIPIQHLDGYKNQFSYQTSIFKSPLFGYDPANTVAKYQGMENRDGKKYHVIETAPSELPQEISKVFLDDKTYFVNYIVSSTKDGEVVVEMKDYKKSGGLSYPTQITSKFNGQVQNTFKVKELKVNPGFSDKLFKSIK